MLEVNEEHHSTPRNVYYYSCNNYSIYTVIITIYNYIIILNSIVIIVIMVLEGNYNWFHAIFQNKIFSFLTFSKNTKEFRCLAGERKNFTPTIVFVFEIKNTLPCTSCWRNLFTGDFRRSLVILCNLRLKKFLALLSLLKYNVR